MEVERRAEQLNEHSNGIQARCKSREKSMTKKAHSLSHTKRMYKYHIVFIPKLRRKVIDNQYRSSLNVIFHH